jgi:hypothetical protein
MKHNQLKEIISPAVGDAGKVTVTAPQVVLTKYPVACTPVKGLF